MGVVGSSSPRDIGTFSPPFVRRRHPWLDARDQTVVIGDDLDSIMSAVLMRHLLGWRVVGFYTDYTRVWYSQGTNPAALRDAVWLDLDISRQEIRSIGHHILLTGPRDALVCHRESVNPNLLRGVTARSGSGRNGQHGEGCPCGGITFPHKYPLGTIHFLLWLYGVDIGALDALQTGLLWLPDSSWINGQSQRYRRNVVDWVNNWISHPALVSTVGRIDTAMFERRMRDVVMPAIVATGFGRGTGQVVSRHLGLGGYQCQFRDPNRSHQQIQALAEFVGSTFGWRRLVFPPPPYVSVEGTRNPVVETLATMRARFGDLEEFLRRRRVFSYVVPNGGKLNYTTGIAFR